MTYKKASTLTVCTSHAHLFMDTSTSSTWAISMGNHFLLENLPCELPYSIEELPRRHQPPPGHLPNSSVQAPQIAPTHSSVKPHHLQSSFHLPIPKAQTLHAPSSSHVSSSSLAVGRQDGGEDEEEEEEGLGPMKEMMYKIAAMQPVDIDPATIKKPKRRNVRISDDPQSVAARHRRERISERIRILQRLVPGGTKMDTASMLDEAIRYVKFLKRQIQELQCNQNSPPIGAVAAMAAGEWPIQPASRGPSSSIRPAGGAAFCFTSDDGTQDGMV